MEQTLVKPKIKIVLKPSVWEQLPIEVWHWIFDHLNNKLQSASKFLIHLFRLSLVSKNMYQVVNRYPIFHAAKTLHLTLKITDNWPLFHVQRRIYELVAHNTMVQEFDLWEIPKKRGYFSKVLLKKNRSYSHGDHNQYGWKCINKQMKFRR